MGLQQKLDAFKAEFLRTAPAGRPALYETKIEELRASFAPDRAVRTGEQAPEFTLPDQRGKGVSLATLFESGPAVVTFYRGGWCPYCNIQLRAYQAVLPAMTALGARLVSISPQLPDGSLSTAEANELTFDVLSDVGNRVARSFGLVWSLSKELREALRSNNKALPGINGDDSWELPVPDPHIGTVTRTRLRATHGTAGMALFLFGITTIDRDDPGQLPRFNGGDVQIRRGRPGCQCFHPT